MALNNGTVTSQRVVTAGSGGLPSNTAPMARTTVVQQSDGRGSAKPHSRANMYGRRSFSKLQPIELISVDRRACINEPNENFRTAKTRSLSDLAA